MFSNLFPLKVWIFCLNSELSTGSQGKFVTGYPLSNFYFINTKSTTMSLFLKALPLMTSRTRPSLVFLCRVSNTVLLPLSRTRTVFSVSASTTPSIQPLPSASEILTSNAKPPLALTESLEWINRTALCGELSSNDVGKRVQLCGWVALHRVHGGLTFFNLRDHSGIVQVLACFRIVGFLYQVFLGVLLAPECLLQPHSFQKCFCITYASFVLFCYAFTPLLLFVIVLGVYSK